MSEQLNIPKFEYTSEQEAEFAANSAEQPTRKPDSEYLDGPRKVGDVPMAAGGYERHMVSADGMKYTRYEGNRYKSAAEFHRAAGVAQDYELEDQPIAEPRHRRAAQMVGKILKRRR